MFAAHGHHGAPGARAAVLSDGAPATVRRTLVLLGLLAGALTASWLLGTASAQAEELGLTGGAEEQVNEVVGTEAPETPGAEEIGDTADEAAGTVDEVTGTAGETALEPTVPDADVVGHVHETVDGATDEVDEQVEDVEDTVPTTEPAQEPGTGSESPATEREDAESASDAGTGTERAEDVPGDQAPRPVSDLIERTDRSHEAAVVDEAGSERSVPADETAAPSATGTASAAGGAHAGAVTGFLPYAVAPAPAPGPEQAALDVLRAVPAAVADEPTVAPD